MFILTPLSGIALLTIVPMIVGLIAAELAAPDDHPLHLWIASHPLPFAISAACTLFLGVLCCVLQYLTDKI
ncbi:hypothetical protein VH86_08670 [Pantoea sp. BL1]|uniref:hypothetical protein n=1 Tax=unclassified Pantoea TaxID=2630326 RepID=UPI0005F7B937|nr:MULTISPECIES: hypothetical protein [unclassified Pantoea]KJV26529.1 hypothetical protein VI01_21720 [Pantoea sp. SM3]KJV48862.1 hypothetical protein VH86_08670 [Pantoea sp. BL1]